MQLIKCENGHIYNAEKFRSCPHCSKVKLAGKAPSDTFGRNQADVETALAEAAAGSEQDVLTYKRVVGMLVVTNGEMTGAGFLLKEGVNSIGRSSNMDVALTAEPTVSRKIHAVIEYAGEDFSIQVPDDRKDVLVNDEQVGGTKTLSDRDRIRLGDCSLILIDVGSVWSK